ncbi:hypothetical protein CMUS01_07414 [Colletotrichum musicola]|uniref:Ubiquinol-cytochrome-c reductase cytochrome c1 n=1 Tax=Colletotrichum musicola TaxID=2175873 RepID=A0A8H6KHP4_9PEZI|nr:hypothetical protein CMUS01_07414 [Colletotrichum musicola]
MYRSLLSYTIEDRQRVYLSCRPILSNHSPKKRKEAKVRDSILDNSRSLGTLISDLGEAKVVAIATSMTDAKIFKSEKVAIVHFPSLFPKPPGPALNAETAQPAQPAQSAESAEDVATLSAEILPAEDLAEDLDQAEVFAEQDLAEKTLAEDNLAEETSAELTHSDDEEAKELAKDDTLVESPKRPPELGGSKKGASDFSSVLASEPSNPVAITSNPIPQLYGIPSLQPSYIPYSTQHRILTTARTILEECCFDFATRWLPDILKGNGWQCACARLADKLRNNFHITHTLRNTAVHRAPVKARSVSKSLQGAINLAAALRDTPRASQLGELKTALDGKLEAMELMKKAAEDYVTAQVVSIRRQKEELDRQEKALIDGMLKDNREHKELAGHLLDMSVTEIIGKKSEMATKDGAERSDV